MEIINNAISNVTSVLSYQHFNSLTEYTWTTYCHFYGEKDYVILYHTLTLEMIKFTKEEFNNIPTNKKSSNYKTLVNRWFLVPRGFDEKSLVYVVRSQLSARQQSFAKGKYNQFTIFPTTGCNARCSYCYEKGVTTKTMSDETAKKVGEYIITHKNSKPHIKWFGGEPLYNPKAINIISEYLNERNVEYSVSMVTNGFLIDKHTKEEWVDKWHVKRVQVTLDGTEGVYNTTKNYVTISDNPFNKVMDNISYLIGMGIKVNIRTNLTGDNFEDLKVLINQLHERFGENKLVMVYCATLYEENGFSYTNEERNILYKQQFKLSCLIRELRMGYYYSTPKFKISHCMADNGTSIVILPDGNLSYCEHHCDDDICGSINTRGTDKDLLELYQIDGKKTEKCDSCFYYPQCKTLEKCPIDQICSEEYVNMKRGYTDFLIKDVHAKYMKNGGIVTGSTNRSSESRNRLQRKIDERNAKRAKAQSGKE